jgi:ABC-type nitrate/sulfonate/bicarbonate transport system substrate-binding protein
MATGKTLRSGSRRIVSVIFGLVVWLGFISGIQAAEPMPLRVSYAAIGGVFTPIWLAQDKELFAKYGLAVDLKFMPPVAGTQALIGRSLDIVAPSGEFIEAGLNGENVIYIAAIANRIVLSLYTKPEIRSLSDLRGRVASALSPGSTSDVLVRILLQEAGLVPGQDVKMLYLKSGPEILAALTKGVIDAGVISAPMTLRARQAGFKEVVDVSARNIPMIHAALGTTRDFVREHPDRVRAFLQGYMAGIKFARTNPEETKRVIEKYTKTTDEKDLEETYQTFVKVWERVPYVSTAAVQNVLNFAKHPAAKTARPEQFIDNSILAELEKSGFVGQLYQP